MSVQKTIREQCRTIVDRAASGISSVRTPSEGWIVTVRKALGMSGAQLARRLGVTRAAVLQKEKNEITGSITLKQMQNTAEALGCRFVYAIVPKGRIKDVLAEQAERKATKIVCRASGHMALESQSLPPSKIKKEITRSRDDLIRDMPFDFWDDK